MIVRLFSAFTFLVLSLTSTYSHALEGHYDVWNQTLDEQIQQLRAQENTPEIVKELDTLQNAKGMIEKAMGFDDKTQSYRQLIEEFPELTERLRQQVDNFATTKFPDFSNMSQKELSDTIKEQDTQIKQLEQSRNNSKDELGSIEKGIDEFSVRSTNCVT